MRIRVYAYAYTSIRVCVCVYTRISCVCDGRLFLSGTVYSWRTWVLVPYFKDYGEGGGGDGGGALYSWRTWVLVPYFKEYGEGVGGRGVVLYIVGGQGFLSHF